MPNQPLFSEEAKDDLQEEYDSEETAIRIASTEMEGAHQDIYGNIDARQTQCDKLEYEEDLQESKGRQEGEKKCEDDLKGFLESKGYSSVDDWIKKNS